MARNPVARAGQVAYLVKREVTGHVKVGISLDPWARLSTLRACSPTPLRLLAVAVPTDQRSAEAESIESLCLEAFRESAVHGEWINADREAELVAHFEQRASDYGFRFLREGGP